jgi:hypothetical protein
MSDNSDNAARHELPSNASPDAEGIQIIPHHDDQINHPNCLVVAPYRNAANGSAIMANVEHYLENKDPTGFPWKIVPVTKEPLRLKAAVDAAVTYAKDNNVPVILLNQDGFSSAHERRQTDTKMIKV